MGRGRVYSTYGTNANCHSMTPGTVSIFPGEEPSGINAWNGG